MTAAAPERLFLLDGTALAYRAYFAFLRTSNLTDVKGRPTGAVYGFVMTLLKLLKDEKPEHLGVAFDPDGPTFRHERYPEYKATRQRMEPDLLNQIATLRDVVRAFNIPVLEVQGFEADDVLATVAKKAAAQHIQTYIVTGDKDLCQCVGPNVSIYNILKPGQDTEILNEAGVLRTWGVPSRNVVDVLALEGDTSDNVPGVPGVGEKTAVKLVQEHGSVREILEKAARDETTVKPPKLREKLLAGRDLAMLSLELVTIDDDVPIPYRFEDLRLGPRNEERLREMFREMNFTTLLAEVTTVKADNVAHDYRIVRNEMDLRELVEALDRAALFSIDTETTGLDPMRSDLVGLSFSFGEAQAWYVPVNAELSKEAVLAALRPVLEDERPRKVGQNAKFDMLALRRAGVAVRGYAMDTMVASFCLDPEQRQHNLDALALRHFGYRKIATKELIGSGRNELTMAQVPVERVGEYAAEDADFTLRLAKRFIPRLEDDAAAKLFHDVEMPLLPVLAEMEAAGVRVDVERLREMSAALATRASALEREVCEIAGTAFNLNSPKQLGPVLFEKLKIQGERRVKATRTGYSTDETTLAKFADHPIVKKLLEFRGVSKLKGTYTDALAELVHPVTGRVHTSYSQVGAITGRLASSDPNLQNIPIRTAEGREIRRAFVPRAPGWTLLSADYSQIELRILAHLSEDEALVTAFRSNADIHRQTAARVFGVMAEMVTPELRGRAKAINFGIVYGMGATRLAEETGMTRKEAIEFIERYFAAYPNVRLYLDRGRETAREKGFVTTLLGRRRSLREMYDSPDQRIAAAADNVAVNTPIQGSAADIIKIAMIRIHRELKDKGLQSQMILQVHDELVFDVAPGEIEAVEEIVRRQMEGAYEMSVPLLVEIGHGEDWLSAH
jgi:DNA polymerase-1